MEIFVWLVVVTSADTPSFIEFYDSNQRFALIPSLSTVDDGRGKKLI